MTLCLLTWLVRVRTCLREVFTDVDPLSVGQPTADGCPSGRGHRGVNGIDVIAQVDRLLHSCEKHTITTLSTTPKDRPWMSSVVPVQPVA